MIQDIQCGAVHNLILDTNGKVYCFGENKYGQCGDGTTAKVLIPKLIPFFVDYTVDVIRCGHYHSYIKTKDDKRFMFGYNRSSECIVFDKQCTIKVPHRIDHALHTEYNIETILEVVPGYYNTTIICR